MKHQQGREGGRRATGRRTATPLRTFQGSSMDVSKLQGDDQVCEFLGSNKVQFFWKTGEDVPERCYTAGEPLGLLQLLDGSASSLSVFCLYSHL